MELWSSGRTASVVTHRTLLLALLFTFCYGGFYIGMSLNSLNLALIASSDELIKAVLNLC